MSFIRETRGKGRVIHVIIHLTVMTKIRLYFNFQLIKCFVSNKWKFDLKFEFFGKN